MNIFDIILGKNNPSGSSDLSEMVKLVQGINHTISLVIQLLIDANSAGKPYKVARSIKVALGRLSEDTQNTIRSMKSSSAKDMAYLLEALKNADYLDPGIKQEIASLFAGIRIINITGDMDGIPDHVRKIIESHINNKAEAAKEKPLTKDSEEPEKPEDRLRNELELE